MGGENEQEGDEEDEGTLRHDWVRSRCPIRDSKPFPVGVMNHRRDKSGTDFDSF
ncbi:unnamed protein product [Brassica oleracea]